MVVPVLVPHHAVQAIGSGWPGTKELLAVNAALPSRVGPLYLMSAQSLCQHQLALAIPFDALCRPAADIAATGEPNSWAAADE